MTSNQRRVHAAEGNERRLTGYSRVTLSLGAALTIAGFYGFWTVSVMFLLLLLGIELLLILAMARFGLGFVMSRIARQHIELISIFIRSVWLTRGAEFLVSIESSDAPRLFEIVTGLCDLAGVAPPKSVVLDMTVGAWVKLDGFRQGAGSTRLGIGYDLLAGLTEAELKAVLAHEVAHAHLVRRGLKRWLNHAVFRAVRLATGLVAHVHPARQAGTERDFGESFLAPADWFARKCARRVAACSRQDEFDADAVAAKLAGATATRSAINKLERLAAVAARLPWRDRVARVEKGSGFCEWLVTAFATPTDVETASTRDVFSPYSTHPSIQDRLAALPVSSTEEVISGPPAINLLVDADQAAARLIAEIHSQLAKEEDRDTKKLNRHRSLIQNHLRPLQAFGTITVILTLTVSLIIGFSRGFSSGLAIVATAIIAGGLACIPLGAYRESVALHVPNLTTFKEAAEAGYHHDPKKIKALEVELRSRVGTLSRKRQKLRLLAEESYKALGQCNYAEAYTAAGICLELDPQSIEGALAMAIAASAFRQQQQVARALQVVQARTRMTERSTSWGAAWACFLWGDWVNTEVYLHRARKHQPDNPTFLALLALAQGNRGKFQSAINSARKASELAPTDMACAKLLINLLLNAGTLKEARHLLNRFEAAAQTDTELMLAMVKSKLLMRDFAAANEWAARLEKLETGRCFVDLANAFESAQQDERAARLYGRALQSGYFPEAHLGLARCEFRQLRRECARDHLLRALDLDRTPGQMSVGALNLLPQTLQHLLDLEEAIGNCQAWIARLNGTTFPKGLQGRALLIYSTARSDAEARLFEIFKALHPGAPPPIPGTIAWQLAERDQQPDGPVRPGIQRLWA